MPRNYDNGVVFVDNGALVHREVVYRERCDCSESSSSSSSCISEESVEVIEPPLAISQISLAREEISVLQGIAYFSITFVDGESPSPVRRRTMKRYREFRQLACELEFSDDFPRKHIFSCTGDKLERRRMKLESWLRMALRHQTNFPEMRPLLREFLYESSKLVSEPLVPPLPIAISVIPDTPAVEAPRQENFTPADATLQIEIPQGVQTGDSLQVTVPDGRIILITIPEGYTGGMVAQFTFNPTDSSLVLVS